MYCSSQFGVALWLGTGEGTELGLGVLRRVRPEDSI